MTSLPALSPFEKQEKSHSFWSGPVVGRNLLPHLFQPKCLIFRYLFRPLTQWQAQQLRLTAFFTSSVDFTEQAWWSTLITSPPETEVTQVKKGVKVTEGVVESGHMVHLELDINTAANFTQDLPGSVLPQLFQELVDLGVEIAQEGDI